MELQGFTIPRKKRVVDVGRVPRAAEPEIVTNGTSLLAAAHEKQRREVEEIIFSNLSDRKLRDFLAIENVKVISNSVLEKRFKNFQASMKRSQSDKVTYAFLLVGFDEASISDIAKNGMPVGSSFHGDLGNRMQGVYLYNHPDLVTPSYSFKNVTQRIMCFKVLRGHSMMVGLDSDSLDASLSGSSHSAASDFVVQSRLQKFRNNAVFLYEFDEASQTVQFPSNVLPFAVVDLIHGKKVHYGKLPSYASFLKNDAQKSELCSVVPQTGLFSGAECIFSSAIETDLLLSPLDIAECLHIGSNGYAWTSILDLLPLRQLVENGHWGRLVTEQEIFIEINSKIKFYMTHTVFQSKHENYNRIVKGLRDTKKSLIGVSNDVTIVLIPDGELAGFLGFPWTEYNQLNALLFCSRHSCLGITDLDRANRESERLKEEALMKDRDNFLTADQRARDIMLRHFVNLKRYDHAGKKHLGTPLHVRKPAFIPKKFEVNVNNLNRPPSAENSPDADYLTYKCEFISAPVPNKKSCVSKKLSNNGNRGMPLGRIPNKMTKFSQKRIRWTDELNRPLTSYKIIEARGDHNPHSQQLHDMDHDEGKSLRQAHPSRVKPVVSIVRPSQSSPAPLVSAPKLNDDRSNVKNNMFREAMSGLSKPITDERTSLLAFELPYQQKDKAAPMAPAKNNSERVVQTSPYANPPPPPPRPAGRPSTNGATVISTPAALLQKLPNNRSQRAYSPSDAYLNKEENASTECDMEIDSDSDSVVEVEQNQEPVEEEFHDPHDIDYDMKIGPVEDPSTSKKSAHTESTKEQALRQPRSSRESEDGMDCDMSSESVDNDTDGTLSKDDPPKEPFNVLDMVLKQIGVTNLKRIVSSAKNPVEGEQRISVDTDLRNMQETKVDPVTIPLSPDARDQIAPPASPPPAIEDVDLRVLQPQVHVAFSLKKEVPKSSVVTSVFGEEDEDEAEKSKENGSSNGIKSTTSKEDKDERAKETCSKKDGRERNSEPENDKDRDRSRRERDDSHHSRAGERDRYKSRDSRERTRERSREREKSSDRHRKDRYDDRDRRERRDHDDRRHRHSSSRRDHSRTPPKAPPLVQQSLAAEETLDIPLPVAPPSTKPVENTPSVTVPVAHFGPPVNLPPPQLVPIGPSPTAAKTAASRQAADRLLTLMREKQKKNSALEMPQPVRQDPVFVQSTYTAPFNCSINQPSNSQWQQPSTMIQDINALKNVPPGNSILTMLGIQPDLINRLRLSAAAKQMSSEMKPEAVRMPAEEMPPPESPPPAASPEPEVAYPQAIPVIGSTTMSIPLSSHDTDFRIQHHQSQDNIPSSPSSSGKEVSPVKKKNIDHDRHKKDEDKDVMQGWGAALVRKKTDVKDSIDSSDEEGELSSDEEVCVVSGPGRPRAESKEVKIESSDTSHSSPPQDPNPTPFSTLPPFFPPLTQVAPFPPRQPLIGNAIHTLMGAAPMQMNNGHFVGPVNPPRFPPVVYREPSQDYGFDNNQPPLKRIIVVAPDSLSFKTQMRPEDLESLLLKMQNTVEAKPLFLYHHFVTAELERQLQDPGCNQETKRIAHRYRTVLTNFTQAHVAEQMGPHDCDHKANRNHLEILSCLKNILAKIRTRNPGVPVEMVYMTHVSPATQLGRNLQDLGIRVLRPAQLTSQYPNLG